MSDLLTVVDDLTLPRNIKIPTDDGHTWATEDALLVQLRDAVSSSLNSGSGAGGSPSTRNVLDSDALHKSAIITSTIGAWCLSVRATITRDATTDLRAWHAKFIGTNTPDEFYINQMRTWVGQIRAMTNPPKIVEITAKCPICNQGSYVNDMGEHVTNPLALTYRPDADNIWQGAKVICRACENVWAGGTAMTELREELDEKDTA